MGSEPASRKSQQMACDLSGPGVRAVVFDVQRCSMHDGPGIRTTVFLKGCPLRCLWCHNPEALSFDPQWMEGPSPEDEGKMVGVEMGVGEILRQLELDRAYFEASGGGLTISGGEPMSRFGFTMALLRAAKEAGFHTCLDTAGIASWAQYEETLPLVDVYHYDYKATGLELHRRLVGVAPGRIVSNLEHLLDAGALVILRCPMIPGVNDQEEHLRAIAGWAVLHRSMMVDILPYHDMARDKRRRLAMPDVPMKTGVPDEGMIACWHRLLVEEGVLPEQFVGNAFLSPRLMK